MFEAALSERLKRIFDLKKVTFDLPSDSREQECIFIEVESAKARLKDARQIARVSGKIRVFCNSDKLPYGYFSKKIHRAAAADTRDLFFFDFEENAGTIGNICERSMSFIYLFESQHDPNTGSIENVTIAEA